MYAQKNPLSGCCDKCHEIGEGAVYPYTRKDIINAETLREDTFQHKYRLTYHVTVRRSFICDRCVRRFRTWHILEPILWAVGVAAGLLVSFSPHNTWMPQIRFIAIPLIVLFVLPRLFYSLIIALDRNYGSKTAANAAELAAARNRETQVEFEDYKPDRPK